ncbi:MAG TPA: amino acid ABC transporter substrate-binding protein [Coleofasciculaceae cyanobacterium]|jgi:general L-amino acid transport system substrate-binding protein
MRKSSFLLLAVMLLVMPLAACRSRSSEKSAQADAQGTPNSGLLEKVKARGKLVCGVSGNLPGFSFVDQSGKYSGLDVDVCRAVAVAVFDNPDAVEFRNLNAKERFTAVQAGEVDILSRNTTLTMSRETSNGMDFAPVTFYDGQGMMVKSNSGIKTLKDFEGKSVCVQTGTTTEQNLADAMRKINVKYTPIVFEEVNPTFEAYAQGRCQGVTADRSQLVSRRSVLPDQNNHVVLQDVMSKEPLAPAVANGNAQWSNLVRWTVYTLIEAEEQGIDSKNVDQKVSSTDPVTKRFLGAEGDLGKGLGVSNDFAVRVIKKVGNYGEIYDRNLGPNTPFKLERGQNNTWSKGGLMYAPPFR